MKIVEKTIYDFKELSENAKERARENYRRSIVLDYFEKDNIESIWKFADYFSVTLKKWSIGPYESIDYSHDATNKNFRGVRLRSFTPKHSSGEFMPTGYYLDSVLWQEFCSSFKRTGDAKRAFLDALEAGFSAWRRDLEYQSSDECIDDCLSDCEFYETGDIVF